MRRIAIIVLVLSVGFVLPAALFAQSGGPDLPAFLAGPQPWMPQGSELGRNSFGVFTGPLDSAFNLFQVQAGSDFRTLDTPYAFGGADNMFGAPAVAGSPAGGGSPFYVGYYMPGPMPWSAYAFFSHSGVANEAASSSTYTPGPSFTDPTTGNIYTWVRQQTDTKNQPRPLAAVNNDYVQALVGIGPITAGLGVKLNVINNFLGANNSTAVLARNYNTTPGAIPTPALDYTITTVSTDARDTTAGNAPSVSDIAFGIPLFLKTGALSHFITVGLEIAGADASNSTSVTYTSPKDPASALVTYQNSSAATVARQQLYQIPFGYALFLPPLLGGSKKNQFIVTADGFLNLAGAQSSTVNTTASFNYLGGGAASTPSTATDSARTLAYNLGASFKIGAGAVHSLYFEPAAGVEYGIVPAVYLDYARLSGGPALATDTTVVKTDANNNGVFTDAGDSTTTTTITYGNTLSDGVGMTATDQFEAFISVPMVLKILPQGWIFGFTIATTPQAFYQFQGVSTASSTKSQSVTNAIVGGATTTTTTGFVATAPSVKVNNAWQFQVIHTLGLNFIFFDKVKLDVSLVLKTLAAGGAAVSNLFDFNNLTIQATVPLS